VAPAGPVLHPELTAVAFLIGTWTGKGAGSYPGSEPFEYEEELTFSQGGKPVLIYAMRTWRGQPPTPSHVESGFWTCRNDVDIDTVVAHATGHVEVSDGIIDGTSVTLRSANVAGWRGSKDVSAIARRLWMEGDTLFDRLEMQAVGRELQAHVIGELHKSDKIAAQ
jgi:hypothetical protein